LTLVFGISFNVGPVHVIGFSTEFYYYLNYGFEQIRNQFKWIEQDLKVLKENFKDLKFF
jgi:hypothetical protein